MSGHWGKLHPGRVGWGAVVVGKGEGSRRVVEKGAGGEKEKKNPPG